MKNIWVFISIVLFGFCSTGDAHEAGEVQSHPHLTSVYDSAEGVYGWWVDSQVSYSDEYKTDREFFYFEKGSRFLSGRGTGNLVEGVWEFNRSGEMKCGNIATYRESLHCCYRVVVFSNSDYLVLTDAKGRNCSNFTLESASSDLVRRAFGESQLKRFSIEFSGQ